MIVYIAGKMTGEENWNWSRFKLAESILMQAGHIVLNPADLPTNMPSYKYMPICLAMLEAADAIYMLDGWRDSPGATLEKSYAEYQHKQIIYEDYNFS